MLVVKQAKVIALNLTHPDRVLSCIPSAKMLAVRGNNVVCVPHRVDELNVLRNIGIAAPSPILFYYDWPGQFTPYQHQKDTAAFLTAHRRALVLNEIGTGKTQSALWAADYLMSAGVVRKCLIVSPLSTLERVWGDAIFKGFPHRQAVVLHGAAEKRRKLLKAKSDFCIINHDGFNIVSTLSDGMFDLVIVDEAAVLRNPSTQRFKVMRKWLDRNPDARLWLMTGTPTPNDPTDAWALAKLVGSPNCTQTYTSFRDQVMQKIGQWKYIPRPDSVDTVRHVLQPAVRYTRDECLDLPSTVVQTRNVDLTPMQKEHYKNMLRHFVTEMATEGTITAVNEAVKLQKLVQISCGVAYGNDGRHIQIDCAPRVNLVKEIIEEVGGKTIIFTPLTGTLNLLERELEKHWSVGIVNGAVSSSKRDIIFKQFQEAADPYLIVAHPATMAHGLTLTAANTIIWYGPITSNEQYTQACGRVERIGKHFVSNVIHIEATALERKMYDRLQNKQKLQGLLLDLIQQEMK